MTEKPNPQLSPPLQRLLLQVADALQAVRSGRSLTDVLARCPAELRPATQALSFYVLRLLGSAEAARALLAPKAPPPKVDALLVSALALLWPCAPGAAPLYNDHTVVDQAVSAVRKRAPASAGFVNAVLRRFLRERSAIVLAAQAAEPAAYNHPQWWIDRVRADWPQQWQAILQANNQHPPMTLRVNARRGSTESYLARLAAAGIKAAPVGPLAPQALLLERALPVTALPGFADGDVSVQDAAAQLAAPLTVGALASLPALAPGARVLDACSAPGGKTAHLLELADLDLLALDSDAGRLTRVQDNLQRLRLKAQTKPADARQSHGDGAWWDGQLFDAILLDAPCSASGIVRRHPDVRWLRRPTDIANLAAIQAELLDALWPTLKPGGRLVYATCSIFKAEGEHQVDAFLQRESDAKHIDVAGMSGHLLPLTHNGEAAGGLPSVLDGFYYALLIKKL
ncbi:16S rRNA (cytosine(967)-C(5))-methyltransferase RsmB [Paucibacter sp. TC2R-5]|uniref:16S rRNA (cytosine(967)-C(5))-methyltransferase RsmB n=1 Tax=Paucibacter sp. TC2R-5 TaxID=2893555 RepID=UPI0021E37373|nr:16S rRNA (cytosine(967)-C(5))-methyltransferase RsmB [Paucibacter sp. TC2R-5]MCV2358627.1 16S rRNA (cytosine(967)-C(5))-methyltransferase RsmB [Paucibacter sp. TC2R-5]